MLEYQTWYGVLEIGQLFHCLWLTGLIRITVIVRYLYFIIHIECLSLLTGETFNLELQCILYLDAATIYETRLRQTSHRF